MGKFSGRSYRQKLLAGVLSVFILFAAILVFLQISQDRNTKEYALASRLDAYATVISRSEDYAGILKETLPAELRATVIDTAGNVLFESEMSDGQAGNHLQRPEVQDALEKGHGYRIRQSGTTQKPYFYYAKWMDNRIIRVALPYDSTIKQYFRPRNIFVFLVMILLLACTSLLFMLSGYFGKGVTNLLKLHIQNSEKGVAVFSSGKELEYSNSKFLQYVNTILGKATNDLNHIWEDEHFSPLDDYLRQSRQSHLQTPSSYVVNSSGKSFRIQILVYPDMGFEVGIVDITEVQKNSILKQQMTSNISHELRTPVTSIRGYLETLLSCPAMPDDKKNLFIGRAYNQAIRLSDLIRDMALISKIEESPEKLEKHEVNLRSLTREVTDEFQAILDQKQIVVENRLSDELSLQANETLVYALFRNLVENSLKYAGEGIRIRFECYSEHDGYLYLTYYDTGTGVPEEHLVKIFERFHRISEGRTRDDGGSGLGLSIVRNAVALHGGEITARNREEGGLQFFFTLKK